MFRVVPIAEEHIEEFRAGLDTQAIRMDGKYQNLICMGLLLD
jgi:hypothetical protein